MDEKMRNEYKERREGHEDIWNCTLDECFTKISPIAQEHCAKDNIDNKTIGLAANFLRIKFERKELKGTIEYEVSKAFEEALIYYTNVEGV